MEPSNTPAILSDIQAQGVRVAPKDSIGGGVDNTTGWSRSHLGCAYPVNTEQVVRIVQAARRHHTPVYPFSCGLNWGYGSKSPVVDGCLLVDLSGMNKILNPEQISVAQPVALIEPGVTQSGLYAHLQQHCSQLTFNVTGSGVDTSLIGNALDGGVGYLGSRRDDIFGLEVVTGAGQVLKTGFRRLGDNSPLALSHPHGMGPMYDGLFFQSNYGIVTSACFKLQVRRPAEVAVSMALRSTDLLGDLIDELARLKREGLLTSVTHIGNRGRTQSSLMRGMADYLQQHCGVTAPDELHRETADALHVLAPHDWTSLASVSGSRLQVASVLLEIWRRTRHLARVMVVSEGLLNWGYALAHRWRHRPWMRRQAAAMAAMKPLHGLALGIPSNAAIDNLLWRFGAQHTPSTQLDDSACGLLFVNPALPLNGAVAARLVAELDAIGQRHGMPLYTTLNIETSNSLVAVINLLFDRRRAEEAQRAHHCADALLEHLLAQGYSPYRARTDMMHRLVDHHEPYWQTARALKHTLDPDNIIAPGRYNIP